MNQNTGVQSCAAWHGKGSGKEVAATNVFVSFLGPVLIMLFPFIALLMQLSGSRLPRYVMCKLLHTRGKARFARLPLDPVFVKNQSYSPIPTTLLGCLRANLHNKTYFCALRT